MARKKRSSTLTKQQQRKKQVLDTILRATLDSLRDANGAKHDVCLYDAALWMLYACTRDEAKMLANDLLNEGDEFEKKEALKRTPEEELKDAMAAVGDDPGAAITIFTDQQALAEELDPGYKLPILNQVDWI